MEGHKQITIRLVTLILAVILIIGLIAGIIIISKKDKKKEEKENQVEIQNIVQNDIQEEPSEIGYDIESLTDFELSFLKMENGKKNIIYSPLSIKYALKMLNEGAEGNTKKQIENVIGNLDVTKYDDIENILSLANAIYIKDTYKERIEEDFTDTLEEEYNAEVEYDEFESAENINKWIEDKTLGQIKNLLLDMQVKQARMILINALAIDMKWKNEFNTENTHGKDFNLSNGNKMKATMMNQEVSDDTASYYKDENVTALAMDLEEYDDTELEFIAIMPKSNLSEYVKNVNLADIRNIINNLKLASETNAGIDITIPKFSFDYSIKLKEELIKLGITDAFDNALADFSKMTGGQDFYADDAIHKANIDFSEKGIKAAAVTVIIMKENAMVQMDKPEEVKIDNPFMYIIRDKNTGEIWFIGTVYEPNSWEQDQVNYQYR